LFGKLQGRRLVDTVAGSSARAEIELTPMIEKRSYKGEATTDELEPSYAASVRRYRERERRENQARWFAFHSGMSELHARLAEEHAAKAEKLCEDPGEEA
jgi:hypothetical protein